MRILVADDHPLFAEALQKLIERGIPGSKLTVVADLQSAHRALASEERYDLAILDLHMPGAVGFEAIEGTLARFPETPLIMISGAATAAEVSRAVALGAKGFMPKTLASEVLLAALEVVAAGGTYLPANYAAAVQPMASPNGAGSVARLTPREKQVLVLLADGHSNKEIGRSLDLTEVTVKLHARSIYRKLGVRNRVEASKAAARLELEPRAGSNES